MSTETKGQRNIYDNVSGFNQLKFMMENMVSGISTAVPVKVTACDGGGSGSNTGYVDVLPLVTMVDGNNEAVQPTNLYHLPYSRIQGGIAAIVIDPIPGDIGLAVFAHSDTSGVEAGADEPVQPSSFRHHSQSDGFYIGGFLNQTPSCFLELTQDNKAILTAPSGIEINGDVQINGTLDVTSDIHGNGDVQINGTLDVTSDIHGNGHSLSNHTHTGVHGETSSANG